MIEEVTKTRRGNHVSVVLSDDELRDLKGVAGDIPVSTFVRIVLKAITKEPDHLSRLLFDAKQEAVSQG